MNFDFLEDCRPRKLKTTKINAHGFKSESRKFGDEKIFQYRDYFVYTLSTIKYVCIGLIVNDFIYL